MIFLYILFAGLLSEASDSELLSSLQEENKARLELAQSYLSSLPSLPDSLLPASSLAESQEPITFGPSTSLVIAIISLPRLSPSGWAPRYLLQSVAAYHKAAEGDPHTALLVCDVSGDSRHPELDTLRALLPVVPRPAEGGAPLHRLEREKRDYVFCLQEAARRYPGSAVLLAEDDSLPHYALVQHLRAILARRLHHDTAYIKLFHPPHLQGYLHPEPHR